MKKFSQILNDNPIASQNKYRRSKPSSTGALAKSRSSEEVYDIASLYQNWSKIVGEGLGEKTKPMRIQNKCLIVGVFHSAYAHQIDYMSEKIKNKIFFDYPNLKKLFKKIRFVVSQNSTAHQLEEDLGRLVEKSHEQKLNKNEYNVRYQKLKSQVKEELSQEFSAIEDEELVELLTSLRIQQLSSEEKKI